MKTRTVVLAVAAVLVLTGGSMAAGAALFGDDSPTATPAASPSTVTERVTVTPTTSPSTATASTAPTEPKTPTTQASATATTPPIPAALEGAVEKEVLPGLISPIPPTWSGQGSDQDSHAYADLSACQAGVKNCPRIEFLSLTSGANRVNYEPNPVRQWAKNVCPARSPESVITLEPLVMGGVTVESYQLPCQGMENYAWHVPGKLLVMTGDAGGATAAPATVQTVLRYSRFN